MLDILILLLTTLNFILLRLKNGFDTATCKIFLFVSYSLTLQGFDGMNELTEFNNRQMKESGHSFSLVNASNCTVLSTHMTSVLNSIISMMHDAKAREYTTRDVRY